MLNPETPLADVEFVAFDVETTGLSPAVSRIVELGAVRFRLDGGEIAAFDALADPGCPIPREVIHIHGITEAMVRGRPAVADLLPAFLGFLSGPDRILLAHNARFDIGFLAFAAARAGVELPADPIVDTRDLARACIRGTYSYRLVDLAIWLQVADSEDHRALSDSRLAAAVFGQIVHRTAGLRTVGDLLRIAPAMAFAPAGTFSAPAPVDCRVLTRAIERSSTVLMMYDGGTRGGFRRITPRALLEAGRRPYLIAYCHRDHTEKTFRIDRIRQLRIEDE